MNRLCGGFPPPPPGSILCMLTQAQVPLSYLPDASAFLVSLFNFIYTFGPSPGIRSGFLVLKHRSCRGIWLLFVGKVPQPPACASLSHVAAEAGGWEPQRACCMQGSCCLPPCSWSPQWPPLSLPAAGGHSRVSGVALLPGPSP